MSMPRHAAKRDASEFTDITASGRRGTFTCIVCGTMKRGKITEGRGKYCGALCKSEHYRVRYAGEANPNYRPASHKPCAWCGTSYRPNSKSGKYCCRGCYAEYRKAALRSAENKQRKVKLGRGRRGIGPPESCSRCGEVCSRPGAKYCSMRCVGLSSNKGIEKACEKCGNVFASAPSSERKYCCYRCFVDDGGAKRAGKAAAEMAMKKYGAKKDANHKEIMAVIRQFVAVMDLSTCGNGVPDGVAYINDGWQLFDIKNPKTSYGRRGLNKCQIAWIKDWRGGPVYLIYTPEDAQKFAKGKFDEVKSVSSGWNDENE